MTGSRGRDAGEAARAASLARGLMSYAGGRLQAWQRLLVAGVAVALLPVMFWPVLPVWRIHLVAPQYREGLEMRIHVNDVKGDLRNINILNHYIGMASLAEAAHIERQMAPLAMAAIILMVLATAFAHRKWFAPMTLPAMLLPLAFLGDMYYWLRTYGQNLDPHAALSNAIKPFTPVLIGHGTIGQFSTDASLEPGFWMALGASLLILLGLHYRRKARRRLEAVA